METNDVSRGQKLKSVDSSQSYQGNETKNTNTKKQTENSQIDTVNKLYKSKYQHISQCCHQVKNCDHSAAMSSVIDVSETLISKQDGALNFSLLSGHGPTPRSSYEDQEDESVSAVPTLCSPLSFMGHAAFISSISSEQVGRNKSPHRQLDHSPFSSHTESDPSTRPQSPQRGRKAFKRNIVSNSPDVTAKFYASPLSSSLTTLPDGPTFTVLPFDFSIPEERDEEISIVQRIYMRAAKDLRSSDVQRVQNARMMLQRLKDEGFESRPKAMSHPSSSSPSPPIPAITISKPFGPVRRTGAALEGATFIIQDVIEKVDTKEDAANTFKRKNRMTVSRSDPNIALKMDKPVNFILNAIETNTRSTVKRKDSVSRIQKRSSISSPSSASKRRTSSATSQQLIRQTRRHSSIPHFPSSPDEFLAAEEPDFYSWSQLLSTISHEERRNAYIRKHKLVISIPVCVVGKDNPVTFTSIDAIEQTLRKHYPEILVRKHQEHELLSPHTSDASSPRETRDKTGTKDLAISMPKENAFSDAQRSMAEMRRISINTCIKTMKTDRSDYDKQLTGVKEVGSFAEEESLKVLFAKADAICCVIEAMKAFPEKEELQLNACTSLSKMASASESNCVHIVQNDGIPAISSILRTHLENPEIVRVLLNTVAYISTAVDLAGALVSGGIHSEVLSVMSRHAMHRDIVKESCFIIGNLLTTVETAHQLMLVGGVHTVINMAEKYPDDESILENTCRTLGSFAIHDETCLDVALAGATKTVIAALSSADGNVTVQECGLWALASLTATEPTCAEVVKLNGVNALLKVLTGYPHEQNLQEYGIRTLCNLSACDDTVASVSSESAVRVLQKVLINFPENVELLEITLVAFSQIILGEEHMNQIVDLTGSIKDVINIMTAFPENLLIQEHGCKLIGNMAINENLRKSVEQQGASRVVIAAMLSLDNCDDVQEIGCLALMNLTADNKDNKVRIKNAGAVPTLLHTLREFELNDNIVLCGLKALGNLVSLEEVCHLLLDERGLETIVFIVDNHSDHVEILVYIAMILCGVTELPDLKEEEARVIDQTLMRIMTSVKDDPDVTFYVCQAVENLIRTDVGRETFMQENRMGIITNAMNTFSNSAQINRCCCKVIAVVTLYVDAKKRLITGTSMKSVLKVMELFPHDSELQIVACATISCIVEKIGMLKHEFVGQGGISLIHKAVITYPKESRMAVVALMALGHAMPVDEDMYPDEAAMSYKTVFVCMRNFAENKEIQISGCLALRKCKITDPLNLSQFIQRVADAMRRHGDEPEVQKVAAAALKAYYRSEHFSPDVWGILRSPTAQGCDIFWKHISD